MSNDLPLRTHASAGDRRNRPSLGVFLIALALAGTAIAAALAVLGFRFVDRSADSVAETLDVTAEAVGAFDNTIGIAVEATEVAVSGLDTVAKAVADAESSLEGAGLVLDGMAEVLSGAVPDSVDAIRGTMPALIQTADGLEDALAALSFLGIGLESQVPAADSLRDVEAQLGEVAGGLRGSSAQLETVAERFRDLGAGAAALRDEFAALAATVERADRLLEGYAETSSRTAMLVDQARSDVDAQRTEGRLIVALLGVLLVLGQVVPLALGWRMPQQQLAAAEPAVPRAAFETRSDG